MSSNSMELSASNQITALLQVRNSEISVVNRYEKLKSAIKGSHFVKECICIVS